MSEKYTNGLCFCGYSGKVTGPRADWGGGRVGVLCVRPPGQPTRLQLVDEVSAAEQVRPGAGPCDLTLGQVVARGAVTGVRDELLGRAGDRGAGLTVVPDPLEAARHGGQVVRQAGMR